MNFETLSLPLPGDSPCGPDLELEGDPEYFRFLATAEGFLPQSYASFDRASINFKEAYGTLESLLTRSRDLRLFCLLAKLLILDRDLKGFGQCLRTIGVLLDQTWETVHPLASDDDGAFRIITLQTLDDMPHVIMPLQNVPLFSARRFGKVSLRVHLLASGKIAGRKAANEEQTDETVPTADALSGAIRDADMAELTASRDDMAALAEVLQRIETVFDTRLGRQMAFRFDRLRTQVADMLLFLDETVGERDPAARLFKSAEDTEAEAEEEAGDDAPEAGETGGATHKAGSLAVTSRPRAREALRAINRYFVSFEPSSPALMLVLQAENLLGKTFFESMQVLVPTLVDKASVKIGTDHAFHLPLEQLPAPEGRDAGSDDSGDGTAEEEGSEAAEQAGHVILTSRRDANAAMEQVAAFLKKVEPSSPIPLLLERARALTGRDFLSLLRDVVPASFLRPEE